MDSGGSEARQPDIDDLCQAFRQQWQRDDRQRIASLLEQVDSGMQQALLQRLVSIDTELRIEAGEQVVPHDYQHLGQDAVRIAGDLISRYAAGLIPLPSTVQHDVSENAASAPMPDAIGPYKLVRAIGEGGMGTVYLAQQEKPVRRQVAVKVIKRGMDSQQIIARFEAERQALAMMSHSCIAKVLDAGTTSDGRPYFAMELVEGIPITRYCDQHHVSINERLDLFVAVCDAVQHAHQKGILHRDIKPSNVLVERKDGRATAKVIDFGLAKALHQKLTDKTMFTHIGQVVGTLEYMSPEQSGQNDLDIDSRTDIYSLGVMLYELLTGSTPLETQRVRQRALEEVLRAIREEDPPRPSARLSSSGEASSSISDVRQIDTRRLGQLLRGELDWIVMKALEKDRTRRFDSATELAQDIKRYLSGDAVESRPPSAVYRLKKIARRYRVGIAATTLVLVAICAALVISILLTIQANTLAGKLRERTGELENTNSKLDDSNKTRAEQQVRLLIDRSEQLTRLYRGEDARPLLPIVEALKIAEDAKSPLVEALRIRLTTKLAQSPKPVGKVRLGHPISSLTYSNDGRFAAAAASGTRDRGAIAVWDTTANRLTFDPIRTKDMVREVVFHPQGVLFASITGSYSTSTIDSFELRRTDSGELAWPAIEKEGWYMDVAFSDDGTMLACSGRKHGRPSGGFILIVDTDSGERLQHIECASEVAEVTFSPDGNLIAGALSNGYGAGGAGIWSTKTGKMISPLIQHPRAADEQPSLRYHSVDHVSFAGENLLVFSTYSAILVWDVHQGKRVGIHERNTNNGNVAVSRLQCTSDMSRVLITAADELLLLDLPAGAVAGEALGRSGLDVKDAVLVKGDAVVITGEREGTATFRDVLSGKAIGAAAVHGGGAIQKVAYSEARNEFLTGGEDGVVRIWSASGIGSNSLSEFVDIAQKGGVIDPTGVYVAGISRDKRLQLIHLPDGEMQLSDPIDWNSFSHVAFSRDSKMILITGGEMYDGIAQVRRVSDLSVVATLRDSEARLLGPTFSLDGRFVAITAGAGSVQFGGLGVWRTTDWTQLHRLETESGVGMFVTAFSPDGDTVYATTFHGEIIAWDVESGKRIAVMKDKNLPQTPWMHRISISPDNRKLVACMASSRIARGWDLTSFDRYAGFVHDSHLTSASFDSTGRYLVTTSYDRTARLWSTTDNSEVSAPLIHDEYVSNATFLKDGKYVVTASGDASARIWSVPDGLPLTGALRHRFPVVEAVFREQRGDVLTRSWDKDNQRQVISAWPLEQTDKPLGELRREVQMLSQHRYDAVSGVTRLKPEEVAEAWDGLTLNAPDNAAQGKKTDE